jgi:mRNA interferase MazF
MNAGDVVLARVQQADGRLKLRPVVVLRKMPPYSDLLVCAVSSQLRHESPGFDDIIAAGDNDFSSSGLKTTSLIRLGLLATIPKAMVGGKIGEISGERMRKLGSRLARFIETGRA